MKLKKKFRFGFRKDLSLNTLNKDKSNITSVDANTTTEEKSTPILIAFRKIDESSVPTFCKRYNSSSVYSVVMIENYFRYENDHQSTSKANSRKAATRSLSLSANWPKGSKNGSDLSVDKIPQDCLLFDTEIELFLNKYVKPFEQGRSIQNKRLKSTNYDSDSGHSSLDSASDSLLSKSAVASRKFLSHKHPIVFGKGDNRDSLVTIVPISYEANETIQVQCDESKLRKHLTNHVRRSHTLPHIHYSNLNKVTVNGQNYHL